VNPLPAPVAPDLVNPSPVVQSPEQVKLPNLTSPPVAAFPAPIGNYSSPFKSSRDGNNETQVVAAIPERLPPPSPSPSPMPLPVSQGIPSMPEPMPPPVKAYAGPTSPNIDGSLPLAAVLPVALVNDSGCCGGGCKLNTGLGSLFREMYDCIYCPDPNYERKWLPIADAAFFVDAARPMTQERIRWDDGLHLMYPDRSEYFWARADGRGKGPSPTAPNVGPSSLDYNELSLYVEAAFNNSSVFIEMPYSNLDAESGFHASGFGDVKAGVKTLFFDTELLQLAAQFKTYIPTGNFNKGLGTGHASLEPALLATLKLTANQYLQAGISEWIPIGGDSSYQGSILTHQLSYNCVLYRFMPDVILVGTLEYNGWSFQHGLYTDPLLGTERKSSGETYIAVGPGCRLFIGERIDLGIGSSFAVTSEHFAEEVFRTEFRFRF
jgi:hypothetical protein